MGCDHVHNRVIESSTNFDCGPSSVYGFSVAGDVLNLLLMVFLIFCANSIGEDDDGESQRPPNAPPTFNFATLFGATQRPATSDNSTANATPPHATLSPFNSSQEKERQTLFAPSQETLKKPTVNFMRLFGATQKPATSDNSIANTTPPHATPSPFNRSQETLKKMQETEERASGSRPTQESATADNSTAYATPSHATPTPIEKESQTPFVPSQETLKTMQETEEIASGSRSAQGSSGPRA